MKRVVVGLSGGVDSSVAAYLLKEQGYEVIGMFMKNWHDDSVTISKECPWLEDSNDAMLIADKLGIPFQTIDLSKSYKERIVDYMFEEYAQGRTPNPDILCNRKIKFDLFLKTAMHLNADYMATGHYCQKKETSIYGKTTYQLLRGKDDNKDQSYFLCQLTQEQLGKALFPIGGLIKSEVRTIARENGLITAEKKDSQGLCFIGKVRLPDFLQQKLENKKGPVVEVNSQAAVFKNNPVNKVLNSTKLNTLKAMTAPFTYAPTDGKVIGNHNGAHYYTTGQRKGLHIGGTPKPLFIIGTDTRTNTIYTGQGESHPGLHRKGLFVATANIHWVRLDLALKVGEKIVYSTQIRYRQNPEPATLYMRKDGLYILFDTPQKAIAAGQFIAWYDEEELVGSGVIG